MSLPSSIELPDEVFRALCEHASIPLFVLDRDGLFVWVNTAWRRLWGYPLDAPLPPGTIFDDPQIKERGQVEAMRRVFAGEEARFPDLTYSPAESGFEGEARRIMLRAFAIKDADGATRFVVMAPLDITERYVAEEALRESQERLSWLFDQSPFAIEIYDPTGDQLLVNRTWRRLWGVPDGVPIPPVNVFTNEQIARTGIRDAIDRLFAGEEIELLDQEFDPSSSGLPGRRRVLDSRMYPVKSPAGELVCVVLAHQDVTERHDAERRREELEQQLQQSRKMEAIGRLAGGVAHDFNNLLTGIRGFAEIGLRSLERAHPLREVLREIQGAADRATQLTGQLLAFSRKQTTRPQTVDLDALLGHSAGMLRRLLREDIELRLEVGPMPSRIHVDPAQVDQILLNLVANARDAMPAGGRLSVAVDRATAADLKKIKLPGPPAGAEFVKLTVQDDGHGMDAETVEHAFEPFFTTKAAGAGTGLGLASVYGIVRQNGGFVRIESATGAGTTVQVLLPRVDDAAAVSHPTPAPLTSPGGTETILLVDDEPMVLSAELQMLTALGYHVLEASAGDKALERSRQYDGEIHLLMTDVIMTSFNGRELFERLSQERPGIGVLFVSGYSDDVIGRHGVLDADVHFLQKPFSIADLAVKIRDVLDTG